MELDKNGDPAMAYMVIDPNGDGAESDDSCIFVSWNRAAYTWNKPLPVAVLGSQPVEGPAVPFSLARDIATDTWGLAYTLTDTEGASTIMLATSPDGGLTWKGQRLMYTPSPGLWNGSFYAG